MCSENCIFLIQADRKMLNQLKSLIRFIRTRGVSERNAHSNSLTSLINLLAFLTGTVALGLFLTCLALYDDLVYLTVCGSVVVIFYLIILFNHLHWLLFTRVYISLVVTQWYGVGLLVMGGSFGQTIAAAAGIFVTFILFRDRKRIRWILLLANLACFTIPAIYVSYMGPIFGEVHDYPLDEVLVYFLCLGWIFIVVATYEEINRKIVRQKEDELRQKEKEVEELLYMTSHDLKAPSNKMLSLLGLLESALQNGDTQQAERVLGFLRSSAVGVNEMIRDMLEVSKLREPQAEDLENVSLQDELDKALFNLKEYLQERNAEVIYQDLPELEIRRGDFAILFQNFIQNGVKYNQSSEPQIQIFSAGKGNWLEISIRDNGIGIAEEHHASVFEMFRRLPTQEKYEGTGIGLGICKKILDLYDAEISISSQVGEYTCFTIRFPLPAEPTSLELVIEPIRNFFR